MTRDAIADAGGGMRYIVGPEWCSCAEGRAARAKVDAERERERLERIEAAWDESGVPARFAPFRLGNSPQKLLAKRLEGLVQREDSRTASVFLHGPYGTGKTGLAVGYLRAYLENSARPSGLFTTLPNMLGALRATYGRRDDGETEEQVIAKYQAVGLLVLDDLGAEQVTAAGAEWLQDRLYRIIGERHDQERPMVFTSNLTLEQLALRIGERLTWRILEMCGPEHVISVTGPNLRDTKG